MLIIQWSLRCKPVPGQKQKIVLPIYQNRPCLKRAADCLCGECIEKYWEPPPDISMYTAQHSLLLTINQQACTLYGR